MIRESPMEQDKPNDRPINDESSPGGPDARQTPATKPSTNQLVVGQSPPPLIDTVSAPPADEWEALRDRAELVARSARTSGTRRVYTAAWSDFTEFCRRYGKSALPADSETIGVYLAVRSTTLKFSTLKGRLVAIRQAHHYSEIPFASIHSEIRDVLAGIRRTCGADANPAPPLLQEHIELMVHALEPGLRGVRDRALILIGFYGALRRSEIAQITYDDLEFRRMGLKIQIRDPKTKAAMPDQVVVIPNSKKAHLCAVSALRQWLKDADIKSGPVFRPIPENRCLDRAICDRTVCRIVQGRASKAAIALEGVSGHSLRAGFATSAAFAGASVHDIMRHLRQRSAQSAAIYIRMGDLWRSNLVHRVVG